VRGDTTERNIIDAIVDAANSCLKHDGR